MAKTIDLQVMLDEMQAEIAAQREILAFVIHRIAEVSGVDVRNLAADLQALEFSPSHKPVQDRVRSFAGWMVGPDRPAFTIIDGGKSD